MIILTNNLSEKLDEGSVKVISSLIKKIKTAYPKTEIITYKISHPLSDCHMNIPNLMLSGQLMKRIRRKKEPVLYFAAPARILLAAIRSFVVSSYARGRIAVILTMHISKIGFITKLLMKLSRAKIIVLCKDMYKEYQEKFTNDVVYIKAGVDTQKYAPVDEQTKKMLRRKYGIEEDKPVVLHVGHMKEGRNIRTLLSLEENVHIVLVTSTYEYETRDMYLRDELANRRNLTLMEEYIPNIEEIYQLADMYFFPVLNEKNCISVPLSVLEAASCNLKIVCTEFGELKQFKGKDGFFFLNTLEPKRMNELIQTALQSKAETRDCVTEYSWDNASQKIVQMME